MTARRPAATLLAARRLASQGLSAPTGTDPADVVRRLLAVQAQDPRGFRLAVRARTSGVTAADVERALTVDRSLVVAWLNRGTLHLVDAADYWWLRPLTTPQLATSSRRRLEQEGVSPEQAERGVAVVGEALAAGPQSRSALRARLDDAGVPTARQAFTHVLLATALADDLVRGPVVDGEQCFVSARQWLGPPPTALDGEAALARLARRYLAGHAPATSDDLAYWAGITGGAARRAFAAVAGETTSGEDGQTWLTGGPGAPARPAAVPSVPPPTLLGPFDPLLHGWRSREPLVGAHRGIVTNNGIFRPFALVGGRAVAVWGLAAGTLTVRPLEPLSARTRRALERDAAAVGTYLGLARLRPVFEDG